MSQPLRADARRNRQRILDAATELFVQEGIEVPLDAVARRADVGIATLYRRFPDRESLVAAVALHAFSQVRDLAAEAAANAGGGGAAPLRRFVLGIAELRIGVLMASLVPILTEDLVPDAGLHDRFVDMVDAVTAVVAGAHAAGELRPDATADDVMLLLAMLTRPLQGVPADYAEGVLPRLVHLVLEGLRPGPHLTPPPPEPTRLVPWPPAPG